MASGLHHVDAPSCIIHTDCCTDNIYTNLTCPRDLQSWNTLKAAAECRHFKPILDLADGVPEGSIPVVFYHNKCRCIFTMKHSLLALQMDTTDSLTVIEDTIAITKQRRVVPPTTSCIFDNTCIFCQKTKYIKKSNTREPLLQCRELRADGNIRNYAILTGNSRLLGLVGCHEMVAAEAKYHATCYRAVTVTRLDCGQATVTVQSQMTRAYDFTVDHIERVVFVDKECVPLAEIVKTYVDKAIEYEECEVSSSTKRNLRRKLETTFGDRLHFCQGMSNCISGIIGDIVLNHIKTVMWHVFYVSVSFTVFADYTGDNLYYLLINCWLCLQH